MSDDKAEEAEKAISGEVVVALKQEGSLRSELLVLETELREADPKFQHFIEKQAELRMVEAKNSSMWKQIEQQMIANNIKSIKGDWGSITIAERTNFKIDYDKLPTRFFVKKADITKILGTYKLEGKPVKGTEPYTTKYLTKRLKNNEEVV